MKEDTSRTALGYVRVSTNEQVTEGYSLDAQEAKLKTYCALRGLDLIEIYREEGESAYIPLADRTEGAALLTALAKHKASHVVVVKIDRLFRNAGDAIATNDAWTEHGLSLHVVDFGGNSLNTSSAVGKLLFGMLALTAEFERNMISERTAATFEFMKSAGKAFNHCPYGFTREGDRFIPNETEQSVMRRVHFLRNGGGTLQSIADTLNAEKIPTKKQGGSWYASTIKNVLHCRQYQPNQEDAL